VSITDSNGKNTNTGPARAARGTAIDRGELAADAAVSKLHKLPAVAKAADLDRKTLVAAIERGELPAVRIGTRYYLTSETIAAFFKPRTMEVLPAT
jgi:hypothetical protein